MSTAWFIAILVIIAGVTGVLMSMHNRRKAAAAGDGKEADK